MALNRPQYQRWLQKARRLDATKVATCFDKFYTLFVAFNMLYVEATFLLAQRDQGFGADLTRRMQNNQGFPDAEGATSYLVRYLGARAITQIIDADPTTVQALRTIRDHIRDRNFHIKLHPVTGDIRDDEDDQLLTRLESANSNTRASAILETIYSVRCNVFHGRKDFDPVQLDLLQPVITILEKIMKATVDKLPDLN
jgi:hypothetical protein